MCYTSGTMGNPKGVLYSHRALFHDVVFLEAVPKTSVGKFNKRALRERFRDYELPGLEANESARAG
jgi:acyl-CoA synthetase (AMP-forming)/AMP-acid ligase II